MPGRKSGARVARAERNSGFRACKAGQDQVQAGRAAKGKKQSGVMPGDKGKKHFVNL